MPNTFSQIYIQIVFAVKGRENLIHKDWKDELYKYITGICIEHDQKLIAINGVSDHIHILIGLKPSMSLSDLVKIIKANSSRFINERKWIRGKFNWQQGYGAFSYAHSQLGTVIAYIENQEAHHYKKTFREEYIDFLVKYHISYNENYLFEWIS
jgi:putative transposase